MRVVLRAIERFFVFAFLSDAQCTAYSTSTPPECWVETAQCTVTFELVRVRGGNVSYRKLHQLSYVRGACDKSINRAGYI